MKLLCADGERCYDGLNLSVMNASYVPIHCHIGFSPSIYPKKPSLNGFVLVHIGIYVPILCKQSCMSIMESDCGATLL